MNPKQQSILDILSKPNMVQVSPPEPYDIVPTNTLKTGMVHAEVLKDDVDLLNTIAGGLKVGWMKITNIKQIQMMTNSTIDFLKARRDLMSMPSKYFPPVTRGGAKGDDDPYGVGDD